MGLCLAFGQHADDSSSLTIQVVKMEVRQRLEMLNVGIS